MRVAIDARPALDPRKTGVGHYASELVRRLPAADPDAEFVAWYLHAKGLLAPRRFFPDVREPNFSEKASRFPARVFEPLSSRLGVPRVEWLAGDFDALLATNFLPPATRSRVVVPVVHDLAYSRFPETAPHMDERWRRRFERALRTCAAVIVPSASAREDLLASRLIDEGRVHVVHHGVDAEAFRSASAQEIAAVRARLRIDGDYVVFLGGLEPRKNLRRLIDAFAKLTTDASLVIAGGHVRWYPAFAAQLRQQVESLPAGVRSRVRLTGYVPDPERAGLLGGAVALAYPSLYEGFGFPVLEAMAARVPVLTSNVSSLPEVAGEAALLVDPHDEDAIADGLRALLEDEALREQLTAAGLARAARFTWEATAKKTAEVLRKAATRAG